MHGLLIIDKPPGMTSHDVVQRVRKLLKTSRVGHLGTLDPMATGVLPLCIGKATRIGRFFASSPKEYVGEIRFGFATTTYDREGEPIGPMALEVGCAVEGDLTRLSVSQTGAENSERWRRYYTVITPGWRAALRGLKHYLERGPAALLHERDEARHRSSGT